MENFKVLLVDDEKMVVKDLKEIIDWEATGFTIIGTAHNGKSALKLYKAYKPDLIITDIRMPQMDGIDFIHEIRKINSDVYILILSSYGEFGYAKAAIAEGVFDYLLKLELTPEGLKKKLKEIYLELFLRKTQTQRALQLELQEYFSRANADEFRWTFQKTPDTRKYIFYVVSTAELIYNYMVSMDITIDGESLLQDFVLVLHRLDAPHATILFCHRAFIIIGIDVAFFSVDKSFTVTSFAKELIRHPVLNMPDKFKISYFEKGITISQFYHRYRNIYPVILWSFMVSENRALSFTSLETKQYTQGNGFKKFEINKFSTKDDYYRYLHRFTTELYENCDLNELIRTFRYICQILLIEPKIERLLGIIKNQNLFEELLKKGLNYWLQQKVEHVRITYSTVIVNAIKYIEQNYMDSQLSIENISHSVGLSSGRLSVLFKKETKKTPVEWITNCRVQKAITLLLNSNLKIYEIAERVGYRSSQYFSQIFYQHTGKKPLDYRKNTTVTFTLGELNQ